MKHVPTSEQTSPLWVMFNIAWHEKLTMKITLRWQSQSNWMSKNTIKLHCCIENVQNELTFIVCLNTNCESHFRRDFLITRHTLISNPSTVHVLAITYEFKLKLTQRLAHMCYFIFVNKQMLKFMNVQYVLQREKRLGWRDDLGVKSTDALAEVNSINMMFHNYLYFRF